MHASNTIALVTLANDAYALPLATMIRSIMENIRATYSVALYVIDDGVSPTNKKRLMASWDGHALHVQWIPLSMGDHADLPVFHIIKANVYGRLFIADLLPQHLHRVIQLDGDMIITADIGELWDIDSEDQTVLAVQDMAIPVVSSTFGIARYKNLGLSRNTKYFNSGLMVVNLDRWRSQEIAQKALHYIEKYRDDLFLMDQEALNAALAGQWTELPLRWNQIANFCGKTLFSPKHIDPAEYQEALLNPAAIHFAGIAKPWVYPDGSREHTLFFDYLDLTDWHGWRPAPSLMSKLINLYRRWARPVLYPLEMIILRYWHRNRMQQQQTKNAGA